MVPPTRTKKDFNKSILAKGILSNIAPPNFLVFRVLGRARSKPQVLQAPGAAGVVSSYEAPKKMPKIKSGEKNSQQKRTPDFSSFRGPGEGSFESSGSAGSEGSRCGPPYEALKKTSKINSGKRNA